MPSASSYTSKLRAYTDARNTKVQYPGGAVDTNQPLLPITCNTNVVACTLTIAGIAGVPGNNGDGGPARTALLNTAWGICADSRGTIYVSDPINRNVRRIDKSGIITAVSFGEYTFGVGPDYLMGPYGLAIDSSNNLYAADTFNDRILKYNPITQQTTAITSADTRYLRVCRGLWMDPNDQLYIANEQGYIDGVSQINAGTISVYNTKTNTFHTDVYSSSGANGNFYRPTGVAVFGNVVYILEQYTHSVVKYENSVYSIFAGTRGTAGFSGDGGLSTSALLNTPKHLYADAYGSLYICDSGNNVIRIVSPNGIIETVVGGGELYNEGGLPLDVRLFDPTNLTFVNNSMTFTSAQVVRQIQSVYVQDWWNPLAYNKICKACYLDVAAPRQPIPPPTPIPTSEITVTDTTTSVQFTPCQILRVRVINPSALKDIAFVGVKNNTTPVSITRAQVNGVDFPITYTPQTDSWTMLNINRYNPVITLYFSSLANSISDPSNQSIRLWFANTTQIALTGPVLDTTVYTFTPCTVLVMTITRSDINVLELFKPQYNGADIAITNVSFNTSNPAGIVPVRVSVSNDPNKLWSITITSDVNLRGPFIVAVTFSSLCDRFVDILSGYESPIRMT